MLYIYTIVYCSLILLEDFPIYLTRYSMNLKLDDRLLFRIRRNSSVTPQCSVFNTNKPTCDLTQSNRGTDKNRFLKVCFIIPLQLTFPRAPQQYSRT